MMPSLGLTFHSHTLSQWKPLLEAAINQEVTQPQASVLIVPVLQCDEENDPSPCPETHCTHEEPSHDETSSQTPASDKIHCCDLLKALPNVLGFEGECHFAPLLDEEGFDAGHGKLFTWKGLVGTKRTPLRVVLVGLGKGSKVTYTKLDKAIQKAFTTVKSLKHVGSVAVVLPCKTALSPEVSFEAGIDAIYQATYRSLEGVTKQHAQKDPSPELHTVHVLMSELPSECYAKKAFALAQARSESKDLVNMPPNLKKTDVLADLARSLEALEGVSVKVYDDLAWLEKEMPAFFEVARGSVASDPPKFITAKYVSPHLSEGKTARKKITLVGKGVMFDTGGYQVKPGNVMNTMKGDMTGGAMVLTALKAIATLQVPDVEVSVYCAATPNKIDSHATVPDTIIRATCGKYIEIRHTDAEGRLTLIDAVTKAEADANPDVMLTIATLTGAAMVAVGRRIAVMSNDTAWRSVVTEAMDKVGDPYQTLDVVEEDYEAIKCKLDGADIVNSTYGRFRGAQTAAAFVMTGAKNKKLPIVHLDIAGADMTDDDKATGIAQKTLIQFVLDQAFCTEGACSK
ncbi:MAG: leucyl aminopeptidase family protein [Vampirovibrionales bacterium]